MPDTRAAEDRVGEFWDALVLGHETAGVGLDPGLAAAVERFQELGAAPPAGARERVWQRVAPLAAGEAAAASPAPRRLARRPPGPAAIALGRVAPATSGHASRPSRPIGARVRSHLATAALLLLTLAVGTAAVLLRAPEAGDGTGPVPALVGAVAAVPGAAPPALLAEATFGAGQLPAGEPEAIFYRLILPPGAVLPYLGGTLDHNVGWVAPAGVGAEVVEAGSYAVRLDAPVRVRAGATGEEREVPAGTEVVLGPGDAVTYPDYGARAAIRAGGDGPAVVVGVAVVPAGAEAAPMPDQPEGVSGESLSRSNAGEWEALAAGPVRVSLWRLELPEGGGIGPYEATGLEALRVERGAITRGFVPPGVIAAAGRPRFYPAGTTAPFAVTGPGVGRLVANAGDGPAVVVALAIEPLAP